MTYSDQRYFWVNQAGLSFLDQVQSLKEELQSMEADYQAQREQDEAQYQAQRAQDRVQREQDRIQDQAQREQDRSQCNYYEGMARQAANILRSSVLDAWSKSPTTQTRRKARNAIAHRGAVLLDYDVINNTTHQGTKRKWEGAFREHYTVDIQLCQERVNGTFTHDLTIELLNQRANITTMEKWDDQKYKGQKLADMQQSRKRIRELCDAWISRWKKDGSLTPSKTLLAQIRRLDSKVHF